MNKCKDCGSWKQTSERFGTGYCSKLRGDTGDIKGQRFVRIFCPSYCGGDGLHTYADFGCICFEEKDKGPFDISFNDTDAVKVSWSNEHGSICQEFVLDISSEVRRLFEWLNELWAQKEEKPQRSCSDCKHDDEDLLFCGEHAFVCGRWAQKEKEPPGKNCPDCTSFPCWTHQFFTGHARFCCEKFERRGLLNCGTYPNCGHNTCPCDKWSPKE